MPDIRKTLILFLLLFAFFTSWSQGVRKLRYAPNSRISLQERITAIAIKSTVYLGKEVQGNVGEQAITVPLDPDAPDFTYFISLATPVENGSISFDIDTETQIFLINSGVSPAINQARYRTHQQDCNFEFSAVPQSEWRAGLESPSYTRSFTDVSHVVVHHSAGSNTATDYTQVVRDIYLYHTNTNGWSDIGYNYLVAQNGTIYTGRDPDSGEQDNVLGAHFCGSNSTTMGVCLLGNYETADPTPETITSLEEILAFKLDKEDLDPFGEYPHAFGQLGSIIGHRDGCSTLCPGESVYQQLGDLRASTAETFIECGQLNPTLDLTYDQSTIPAGEEVAFQNQSNGYSQYKWILEGANPSEAFWEDTGTATYNDPGIYDVTLIGYLSDSSDTLFLPDLITVQQNLELDFTLSQIQINAGETITFQNQSTGYDEYQWLFEGGSPRLTDWTTGGTVTYPAPGIFGVQLVGFTASQSDTLFRERIIAVSGQPRVYPNPINSMAKFTIASFHEIEQVKVIDFSGRTQILDKLPDGKYQMPYLRQGMYFISVQTTRETVTKKILVR